MGIEYQAEDELFGHKASRANRFYFDMENNGAYLRQMESYHADLQEYKKVKRHMFGGFQLMQNLEVPQIVERFKVLRGEWGAIKREGGVIHTEFASFQKAEVFELFVEHVLSQSDSVGMNEQELATLLDFWEGRRDVGAAQNSKPSLAEILSQTAAFFELQHSHGLDVSRLHLHPYGSFILCYDPAKWHSGVDSLAKSAVTTLEYCLQEEHILDKIDNFWVSDYPATIHVPNAHNLVIHTNKEQLRYSF